MLWLVGLALLFVWLVLLLVHPSGWIHIVLLAGVVVLVVQTAAYRKTRAALKDREKAS